MNIKSVISITIISIAIFLGNNASYGEVNLEGYIQKNEKILQFSDVGYLPINSSIFLSLKASESHNIELVVKSKGQSTILSEFIISEDTEIIFPRESKKIELSSAGRYDFIAIDSKENIELAKLVIFIESIDKTKIPNLNQYKIKEESSKINAKNLLTGNFREQINLGTKSLSYDDTYIAISSSRSAGSKIYKQYAESVVLIVTDDGLGSGVLIWEDLVITNKHVVGNNKNVTIIKKPATFEKIENARKIIGKVIKFDEEKDLALVQLNRPIKAKLIKLADPKKIEVAMKAHAIGHPLGNYWSYTEGVVSQIRPSYEWRSGDTIKYIADVIQTQTPINPGNSGGPLFNSKGQLIGINSFGSDNSPGLNFAVATTSVREFLNAKNSRIAKRETTQTNNECWVTEQNENAILCDKDNSGKPEELYIDDDGDGEFDRFLLDENENGEPELLIIVFKNDDGSKIHIWKVDPDETGQWIAIGYDYDRDNEVDEWENI